MVNAPMKRIANSKRVAEGSLGARKGSPSYQGRAKTYRQMQHINLALHELLRKASPKSTPKDISWTCVDLTSLWEVSKEHLRHIKILRKCSYPRDREKLERLLTEM
jgi:hypothetical protein